MRKLTLLISILLCSIALHAQTAHDTAKPRKPIHPQFALFGNYSIGDEVSLTPEHYPEPKFSGLVGGGVRISASQQYWEAGFGIELGGYQSISKADKGYYVKGVMFDPKNVTSNVYARGRYTSAYVFLNAQKKMLKNRLGITAGLLAGLTHQTYEKSFCYFSFRTPNGDIWLSAHPGDKLDVMYGYQASISVKVAKNIYVFADGSARCINVTSVVPGGITGDKNFINNNDYSFSLIRYHAWYYPLAVGIKFRR